MTEKGRQRKSRFDIELRGDGFKGRQSLWFGRNRPGEYFLGLMGYDAESITIQPEDRKKVAAFLRRCARRLDP